MRRFLATIVLAVVLTGCHHRLVMVATPPPPVETTPANKWVLTGTVADVIYYPEWDNDNGFSDDLTLVKLTLSDGKTVAIAFPDKNLVGQFTKGQTMTVEFTGSYSRATLISVQ